MEIYSEYFPILSMQTIIITGGAGFIGSNNEYVNLEITKILLQSLWKSEELISFVPDRPGHDKRYAIDASKIEQELSWLPKIKFEEGIQKTIQSYL
jgi:dTDP-glucose 4,6-dehydratase